MMPLRTKSTTDSARFCTPFGTSALLEVATKKNTNVITAEAMDRMAILLIAKGDPLNRMAFHSSNSPIGGNFRAATMLTRLTHS